MFFSTFLCHQKTKNHFQSWSKKTLWMSQAKKASTHTKNPRSFSCLEVTNRILKFFFFIFCSFFKKKASGFYLTYVTPKGLCGFAFFKYIEVFWFSCYVCNLDRFSNCQYLRKDFSLLYFFNHCSFFYQMHFCSKNLQQFFCSVYFLYSIFQSETEVERIVIKQNCIIVET